MSWATEAELIAVSTVNRQQKKRSAGKYSIDLFTGSLAGSCWFCELKRRGFCFLGPHPVPQEREEVWPRETIAFGGLLLENKQETDVSSWAIYCSQWFSDLTF